MYDIRCLTLCKIIDLGDKIIPPPLIQGTTFLGVHGCPIFSRILRPLCVNLDPGSEQPFLLFHGPPNQWWGSRVRTPGTPSWPAYLARDPVSGSYEHDEHDACFPKQP